jgi:hypothetical protein
MVAEFEANLGHMRTREGMPLAKKNGKLKGKQPKLPEPARRSRAVPTPAGCAALPRQLSSWRFWSREETRT